MDWTELLNEYGSTLVLYARQWTNCHADAEEAVQDGFLRVWRSKTARWLPKKKVVPYLFKAVKSAALDRWRSQSRRRMREEKAGYDLYDTDGLFTCDLEKQERQTEIQRVLRILPDEQREVVVMKIWGDLTFKDIARSLGIPPNTAASRYRYGLKALRQQLSSKTEVMI